MAPQIYCVRRGKHAFVPVAPAARTYPLVYNGQTLSNTLTIPVGIGAPVSDQKKDYVLKTYAESGEILAAVAPLIFSQHFQLEIAVFRHARSGDAG